MSHNIYNEDNEAASTSLCNYLILIENPEIGTETIVPITSITKAIEIVKNTKRFCRLYERAGSVGKNWKYLCDCSYEVI